MATFEQALEAALAVLRGGGLIHYRTTGGWAIAGAVQNKNVAAALSAAAKTFKERVVVVLADERDLFQYVAAPDPAVLEYIASVEQPTAVVMDGGINLPDAVLAPDGSVCLWLSNHLFSRHLVKRLQQPLAVVVDRTGGRMSATNTADYEVDGQEEQPIHPLRVMRWTADGPLLLR